MMKVSIREKFNTHLGLCVVIDRPNDRIAIGDIITDGPNTFKVVGVQFSSTNPNSDRLGLICEPTQ